VTCALPIRWAGTLLFQTLIWGCCPSVFGAGFVVAWGGNNDQRTIVPSDLTNVVAISGGGGHSLALKSNGTVVAWGYNGSGQTNVPVGLSNVIAVAGGSDHSVALKRDGTVVAWGWTGHDQTNIPPGLSNVVAIAAGGYETLALRQDGGLSNWGAGQANNTIPPGVSNVMAIACGTYHSVALLSNGTVLAWGPTANNGTDYGQANVPLGLTNVVAIAAGTVQTLALKSDGSVIMWGTDINGALKVPPTLTNTVAVASGSVYSLVLSQDGLPKAWGADEGGATNIPPNLSNVVAIASGQGHGLAIVSDGSPAIAVQPVGMALDSGATAMLSALAVGSPPLAFQWRLYGTNLPGAPNASVLRLPSVRLADAGPYSVLITNSKGSILSASATLTVKDSSPSITANPLSQTAWDGARVDFGVQATGSLPLRYQWLLNGNAIGNRTNASLTLTNARAQDAGCYRAVVSNSGGSITSAPACLEIVCFNILADGHPVTNAQYSFVTSTTVSLQTGYSNPNILYTLDGSDPSFAGTLYQGPFAVSRSARLRAIVYSADFSQSCQSAQVKLNHITTYSLDAMTAGGGSIVVNPSTGPYYPDTDVTLTAIPAAGWTFLQWLGSSSSTNPSITLRMTADKCMQAVFGTTLNTTVAGNGTINIYPSASVYPYGTSIRLTAVPLGSNYFVLWGNAATGNANPINLLLTSPNQTVSSLFGALPTNRFTLTVLQTGLGTTSSSLQTNLYTNGQTIAVTAMPGPDQVFLGWSGDAEGSQSPLSLSMVQSKLLVATFTRRAHLKLPGCRIQPFEDRFPLILTGEFGAHYRLETSRDLSNWIPVWTLTNSFGSTEWNDSTVSNAVRQFYRAVDTP
jgi:hypothetical protein